VGTSETPSVKLSKRGGFRFRQENVDRFIEGKRAHA
jgi:hypothetical protein